MQSVEEESINHHLLLLVPFAVIQTRHFRKSLFSVRRWAAGVLFPKARRLQGQTRGGRGPRAKGDRVLAGWSARASERARERGESAPFPVLSGWWPRVRRGIRWTSQRRPRRRPGTPISRRWCRTRGRCASRGTRLRAARRSRLTSPRATSRIRNRESPRCAWWRATK